MDFITKQIIVPATLGNGKTINFRIEPYEAIVDSNGYIRAMSIDYNDGSVGNFQLMPNNKTKDKILGFCSEFLTPIGVEYASNRFINLQNKEVENIVRYMAKKYSKPIIQDLFQQWRISDSAYYALDNGEKVITHPLKV